MPHVAEAVLAGDLGLHHAAERYGQLSRHFPDRVRGPAGDVVRPLRAGGYSARIGRVERQYVAVRHVADVHEVAALAAVLEDSRRDAVLQARAEDRGHSRVGRVPRHPRAVHVVVPQRHGGAAGQPRPVRRQVLLRQLARRVGVPRVQGGVLAHRRPRQRRIAARAARLEYARFQVGCGPGKRPHAAVTRAFVGALAVDHHGRGENETGHLPASHGVEQHRGAGHVDVRVEREVGQRHAEPDHGGQVTHGVHAVERVVHRGRVTNVPHAKIAFVRDIRGPAIVDRGAQRVEAADLMPGRRHGLHHMGSDEPRRSSH